MTDSMRDLIRDELAGWPTGSGYYSTTISVDEAQDMADAVLAVLTDLPESVIERAAEGLQDAAFGQGLPEAPIDLARAALRAAFGGEQEWPIIGWWLVLRNDDGGVERTVIGQAESLNREPTRGYASVEIGGSEFTLGPGYGGTYVLEAMAEQRGDLDV